MNKLKKYLTGKGPGWLRLPSGLTTKRKKCKLIIIIHYKLWNQQAMLLGRPFTYGPHEVNLNTILKITGVWKMLDLNGQNYESEIGSSKFAVVDVWSDWWVSCKVWHTQFESLVKENEDQISYFSVNAGQNRGLMTTLKIRGIPAFLFYKNGLLSSTLVGTDLTRDELFKRIHELPLG